MRHLALSAVRRYFMMFGLSLLPFSVLRIYVARICGVQFGRGCYLGFHVYFDTNYPSLIRIGDGVTISHCVSIHTHTGSPATGRLTSVYNTKSPVTICDGAWISANSVVLPGVVVGADCMIGAGSIVTKDTEPISLYAGNPASKIKSIALDIE